MAFDLGSEITSAATGIVKKAADQAYSAVASTNLGRVLQKVGIMPGANRLTGNFVTGQWDTGSNTDWRVRLSLPPTSPYTDSLLLEPLKETNGLVFPYTPTVMISHSAKYNAIEPTHSNYPFPVYTSSAVDTMTISGEFTVENSREAEYWIAAVHFLKSITKMAYGETSNQGNPPPVVKLNGYGDYVFKDVPVVITNFTLNLDPEVDYIEAYGIGPNGSWAPSRSTLSLQLMPTYSRDKVNKFSLDTFVSGEYLLDNNQGYL